MPTTSPNFGLRAPASTDILDVAGDMTRLRDDVERELGGLTTLQAQVNALATALNDLADFVTTHDPQVLRWSNIETRQISAGQTWQNIGGGYSWTWTVPTEGVLLLVGGAELNDDANTTGDPRARILASGGAVVSQGQGYARNGIAVGSQSVTLTGLMDAVVQVQPGALTLQVQCSHTSLNANRPGEIRRAGISAVFVPVLGSFPSFTLPTDPDTPGGDD